MTEQELITKITAEWADKGMIIEGGWRALEAMTLQQASPLQKLEMRKAYFAGAQHLFASIIATLDPGSEATEKDLRRMDLIHQELKNYVASLKAPHGN